MSDETKVPTMPGPFSQPQGLRPTNETPFYENILATRAEPPPALRLGDLEAATKLAARLENARRLYARITTPGDLGFSARMVVVVPAPSGRVEQIEMFFELSDLGEPVAARVVELLLAQLHGLGVVP